MPSSSQKKHTVKVGRVPGSGDPMEVDPRWLLKWLGVVFGAALLCGYLTLCGLFYQGQWQFVLHPAAGGSDTPAKLGLVFEDVRFDYTEAGQPQLHGWWIPAEKDARYAQETILYLHDGDGSLGDTLPRLRELHNAGLNVFAFDYRGFGASSGPHPDKVRMREDAAAALLYLTQTRNLPATQIIPYGEGVGGSLAAQLVAEHANIPAVILDNPLFDLVSQVKQDPRAELIPVRLLFHERFQMTATTHAPKLLLLDGPRSSADISAIADPKLVVHLDASVPATTDAQRSQSLSRFLDEYLPAPTVQPQ